MCLIIKGGNYLGIKIIILAIESTYFKFIIREINDKYFITRKEFNNNKTTSK